MASHSAVIGQLLKGVGRKLRADNNRIYLTGLGMDGYGAWFTALGCPDLFAAVAPICGGGDFSRACVLRDVPIWVFHGAKDLVVSAEESINMVEAMKNCGGK